MKHYDSMWPWLLDMIRTDKERQRKERVENAAKAHAQAKAEVEAERLMCDFYSERVANIDHETHWWEYAEAKQKEADHLAAWRRAVDKAQEAEAKLEAEKARNG